MRREALRREALERHETFWMAGVQFPLDIVFIRADGTIGKIVHNLQPGDLRHWSYPRTAAVVEVAGGFCRAHGIKEGDKVGYGKIARVLSGAPLHTSGETATTIPMAVAKGMSVDAFERLVHQAAFRALVCPACGTNRAIQSSGQTWGSGEMAAKMADVDSTRCIGCGFVGSIDKFDTALPTAYRMTATRTAQVEPGMAECGACGWFAPRDEFVDQDGNPGCPDCGSASVKFARVASGTFDGKTECSMCGGAPPAGDWKGASGECEACAEQRDGSVDRTAQGLTIPSIPSAKPTEDSGEKTARDPEEDERREPSATCRSCGRDATDGYEMAGEGLLCPDCADQYVDATTPDDLDQVAMGHGSVDPLRSLTEASKTAQQDDVRCPGCDEPVGPGGSCGSCGSSFADFERMSASVGVARREAAFPAKFRGTCKVCGRYIDVGEMINWSKDKGASHQSCGQPGGRSRPRSRGTWTGCSCGSVEEFEKPSDCFSCQHDR